MAKKRKPEPGRAPSRPRLGVVSWVGLALVGLGVPLFVVNEVAAYHQGQLLHAAEGAVVDLGARPPGPATEGKLVAIHGPLESAGTLRDPVFGLELRAVRLERRVEAYLECRSAYDSPSSGTGPNQKRYTVQWVEVGHSSNCIDRHGLLRDLRTSMPSLLLVAADARIGGLRFGREAIEPWPSPTPIPVPDGAVGIAAAAYDGPVEIDGRTLYVDSPGRHDHVGGVRIRFFAERPGTEASALGVQSNGRLVPFRSPDDELGPLVRPGRIGGRAWIGSLASESRVLHGVFRIVLLLALAIGAGLLVFAVRDSRRR